MQGHVQLAAVERHERGRFASDLPDDVEGLAAVGAHRDEAARVDQKEALRCGPDEEADRITEHRPSLASVP